MKRRYSNNSGYKNRPYKRPRQGNSAFPVTYGNRPRTQALTRTYPSLVPLATRGYRPNNVELKVNDIDTTTYNVSTTGSFTILANPQLGSDMNGRIGRKVTLRSFYIKGRIQIENAGALTVSVAPAQQCRMIVFQDMQPNGATPAVTDLLVSATPASHLNLNGRDRFKIYCDKEFVFDPMLTTATLSNFNRTVGMVRKYKKINMDMVFTGSAGTIADIASGALYMFWIGSQAAAANTDCNFIGATRVRYSDQ